MPTYMRYVFCTGHPHTVCCWSTHGRAFEATDVAGKQKHPNICSPLRPHAAKASLFASPFCQTGRKPKCKQGRCLIPEKGTSSLRAMCVLHTGHHHVGCCWATSMGCSSVATDVDGKGKLPNFCAPLRPHAAKPSLFASPFCQTDRKPKCKQGRCLIPEKGTSSLRAMCVLHTGHHYVGCCWATQK